MFLTPRQNSKCTPQLFTFDQSGACSLLSYVHVFHSSSTFTAFVSSVNTTGELRLHSISFNLQTAGKEQSDWSVVSWFWPLQHLHFSRKYLAVKASWRELVSQLQHLEEQRAANLTKPNSEPQTKHQITAAHSFLSLITVQLDQHCAINQSCHVWNVPWKVCALIQCGFHQQRREWLRKTHTSKHFFT